MVTGGIYAKSIRHLGLTPWWSPLLHCVDVRISRWAAHAELESSYSAVIEKRRIIKYCIFIITIDNGHRQAVERCAFAWQRFCDLSTYDRQELIMLWPDCRKYLCKFCLWSLQWFGSCRDHKISAAVAGWLLPDFLSVISVTWTCLWLIVISFIKILHSFRRYKLEKNDSDSQTDRRQLEFLMPPSRAYRRQRHKDSKWLCCVWSFKNKICIK